MCYQNLELARWKKNKEKERQLNLLDWKVIPHLALSVVKILSKSNIKAAKEAT